MYCHSVLSFRTFSLLSSTIKKIPPKAALSGFCFHCALGSCCKTILWFALMQCSCWEVQYLSSSLKALYSCSCFPLLLFTKTACNSLISVLRKIKFVLILLLILECSGKGGGEKPLWTSGCYTKVRRSHCWLEIIIFKPLFSFMQPIRRRERALISDGSLSRNGQQYALVHLKSRGLQIIPRWVTCFVRTPFW